MAKRDSELLTYGNQKDVRRADGIRTESASFDPVQQLMDELIEPRPYKKSDFKKEYFIPDF